MTGRVFVRSLTASLLSLIGAASLQGDETPGEGPNLPEFGSTRVWSVVLDLSAEEFAAMQPAPPAFPGGPPGTEPPRDGREVERNLFGTEFPWVDAAVRANGTEPVKASLRYAGDVTYLVSAAGAKRPFAVLFATDGPDGPTSLHLHAARLDPSRIREALAFAVFRDLGVPCPRTAFADVTLAVAGRPAVKLGLYTVVEGVEAKFLADRFGSADGLLMKPFGIRGVDAPGDDWPAYAGVYRPQREPTPDEARRVIEFAKLVNDGTDQEFRERIGSFVDVDAFLRFLAANALTSNLEGFFALGHNYHLYLDAKSGKFAFLPGDLEFAFSNFLLMGSADELTDLSLTRPYPGENKLPDRLLAMPGVKDRYLELVKELTATAFTKERLLRDVEAIEAATKPVRDREPAAAGPADPPGPQPPDLRAFAEKRTAAVAAQLAGTGTGFVPRPFSFGPPGGGFGGPAAADAEAVDETTFREIVKVPDAFDATLFASPPDVHYPVAISAAPSGEVYVAVDEQGSLGRTPGGGKVLRCVDGDGDGKADRVTEFARVEHPRGVCYRDGSLWVMHPPTLSVFRDEDGDGVAEVSKTLVTGLSTELVDTRGADHAANCVRMGIDGWLYVGVGDYGIERAVGTDGSAVTLRGGGVVRVRPDGTELEVYCTGLRNPFDLAIDPFLNLFTRDNTNDGGGWDTRVSHLVQSAEYGYPRLFANFTDEIMPTLGTFGGGGGTGGLFVDDPSWPEGYRRTLLTGDWGRSEVYRHELASHGPTFDLEQEVFVALPRATGMDMDASGRLYAASWYQGEASVYVGPNVGFVARVTPKGLTPRPFPDLETLGTRELVSLLGGPGAVTRLHAQGEVLRRGRDAAATRALMKLASDGDAHLEGRVAAIFTLKQLDGSGSHRTLATLAGDPAVREFALRALADRKAESAGGDVGPFVASLRDESPRVRAQAIVGLGRLGDASVATSVIPLTTLTDETAARPHQNDPDPGRVVPHLASRTLVALRAGDACVEALDGPHWRGALRALRHLHDERTAERLIETLAGDLSPEVREGVVVTLIRLYHREADYDGSWWGIRPDSTGPYYDRAEWEATPRIAAAVTAAVLGAEPGSRETLVAEMRRHGVSLPGLADAEGPEVATVEPQAPIVLPKADPADPNRIGGMAAETALQRTLAAQGEPGRGAELFKSQSCAACHTTANGEAPKGPHLADIGKRYATAELAESILSPSAKIAQGYEAYSFVTGDGLVLTGFVVREKANATVIRESNGVERELRREEVEARERQSLSAMPQGLANNLTPGQLADLLAYLASLK